MKVLIKIQEPPVQIFLVELSDKDAAEKVKSLIEIGRYPKAIMIALQKGRLLEYIARDKVQKLEADLILTANNVHFDLT